MHGKSSLLIIDIVIGVECFSLSSSPISSEEGHIIACPHTTVTLTCTATQTPQMTWLEQGRQIDVFFVSSFHSEETRVVHDDPYTLTLIAVDNNITTDGQIGDFTSILEVMVDDIDNGTDIECAAFPNTLHLFIFIASEFSFGFDTRSMLCVTLHSVKGSPHPPSNVVVVTNNFHLELH